jgi:hypothetical protein
LFDEIAQRRKSLTNLPPTRSAAETAVRSIAYS